MLKMDSVCFRAKERRVPVPIFDIAVQRSTNKLSKYSLEGPRWGLADQLRNGHRYLYYYVEKMRNSAQGRLGLAISEW